MQENMGNTATAMNANTNNSNGEEDEGGGGILESIKGLCGSLGNIGISPGKNLNDVDDNQSIYTVNESSAMFARALMMSHTNYDNDINNNSYNNQTLQMMTAKHNNKSSVLQAPPRFAASHNSTSPGSSSEQQQQQQSFIHPLSEHRAQITSARYSNNVNSADESGAREMDNGRDGSSQTITIGLSLSRRHSNVGHPDTVTRQTAFDFNELQDRAYKFVSSTDPSGWRAGGGESGKPNENLDTSNIPSTPDTHLSHASSTVSHLTNTSNIPHKSAAPDVVHIPIIQIYCEDSASVDAVISALARGEILIPHMSLMPEALSVNGVSPPDLVVRFGCERNDDAPPDQWPNWCLEFIHNQIFEFFANTGAQWTKRPFQMTLAKKVRWKTVKHMNQYFAHSEKVISAWREKGPQYLDPQLSYIEGGATPEEVAHPHGLYLLRDNGRATNYFPPNLEPPYTTKMSRSLLLNVLNKSWDKKKRDWSNEPLNTSAMARLITPSSLLDNFCGVSDQAAMFGSSAMNHQQLVRMRNAVEKKSQKAPFDSTIQSPKKNKSKKKIKENKGDARGVNNNVIGNELRSTPPTNGSKNNVSSQDQMLPTRQSSNQLQHLNSINQKDEESEISVEEKNSQIEDHKSNRAQEIHRIRSPKKNKVVSGRESPSSSYQIEDDGASRSAAGASAAESHTTIMASNRISSNLTPRNKSTEKLEKIVEKEDKRKSKKKKHKDHKDKEMLIASTIAAMEQPKDGDLALPIDEVTPKVVYESGHFERAAAAPRDNMQIRHSLSQASMEYSLDSAQVTTDASTTNHSLFSFKTHQMQDPEGIPSDEELGKIGWAKAYDSNSGNYYYYTFDRSKIVWENPLSEI